MGRVYVTGHISPHLQELGDVLTGGGHTVSFCAPETIVQACQSTEVDLVLLLAAQKEDLALITLLKHASQTKAIPLIVALVAPDGGIAAQALEMGADEFLLAPFRAPEVLARVTVILKLRQDRRLLLASSDEFRQLFRENPLPLFIFDPQGETCQINLSLQRLLGYAEGPRRVLSLPILELFSSPRDQERFQLLVSQPPTGGHLKLHLRHCQGQAVPVLVNDLAGTAHPQGQLSFQVEPVGEASPLKRTLKGLVDQFLPSARSYLALWQMTPLLGGRYKKEKKLGQGSFGEVWLVLDTESLESPRCLVAKIPFHTRANPKFRKEAEICRKLSPHPGVVQLLDTVEDEGKVILIQEYVEGKDLQELLEEELPPEFSEMVILQLIDVVAHAHKQRVMHRDIKPNNIIIRPDGVLKLLDYGAAKLLKEKDISATMVGSRPYMAPEQIMGKSERRSDIWAIGVLMYLLYTGDLPFYSEVEKILIDEILEQEPAPPRELNPEIPAALEEIILKCLKKKLEERYASALELKADLLRHFPAYGRQAAPRLN
jgi:CheY-like chemotaxis protein/predicted Ser/Thr protein kinase